MDSKFQPAIAAMQQGDSAKFIELVRRDPALASARSNTSHPTLLQCLVLDGQHLPGKIEMARTLIDAGADLAGPLVAAASCDNVELVALLLDRGASIDGIIDGIDGAGKWSPLEEALYWNSSRAIALLLARGAAIRNLRVAAGVGRTDRIEGFFDRNGNLTPEAGTITWPFGDLDDIEKSNFGHDGKNSLAARVRSWSQNRQGIINNAFVYACSLGHMDAAALLLEKGAEINAIPGGFDFAGTGLHYAALHGQFAMVEFLIAHGADPVIPDSKIGATAAGWAQHGGHPEVQKILERKSG
jgi:ankyrin repeat protein